MSSWISLVRARFAPEEARNAARLKRANEVEALAQRHRHGKRSSSTRREPVRREGRSLGRADVPPSRTSVRCIRLLKSSGRARNVAGAGVPFRSFRMLTRPGSALISCPSYIYPRRDINTLSCTHGGITGYTSTRVYSWNAVNALAGPGCRWCILRAMADLVESEEDKDRSIVKSSAEIHEPAKMTISLQTRLSLASYALRTSRWSNAHSMSMLHCSNIVVM